MLCEGRKEGRKVRPTSLMMVGDDSNASEPCSFKSKHRGQYWNAHIRYQVTLMSIPDHCKAYELQTIYEEDYFLSEKLPFGCTSHGLLEDGWK